MASNVARFPKGMTTQPKRGHVGGVALLATDIVHLPQGSSAASSFHFDVADGTLAAGELSISGGLSLGGNTIESLGTVTYDVQTFTDTTAAGALDLVSAANKNVIDITFTHGSGGGSPHAITLPPISGQGQQLIIHATTPNTHVVSWAPASGETIVGSLENSDADMTHVAVVLVAVTSTIWLPLSNTSFIP
jgi:hypothetical protein